MPLGNLFNVVGGRVEPNSLNPAQAFEMGAKLGMAKSQSSLPAFLKTALDARQQTKTDGFTNAINSANAKKAKLQEIVVAGSMPGANPRVKALAQQILSNPQTAQLVGVDPSKGGGGVLERILQPGGAEALRDRFQQAGFDTRDVDLSQDFGGGLKVKLPLNKRGELNEDLLTSEVTALQKKVTDIEPVETVLAQAEGLMNQIFPDGLPESGTESVFVSGPSKGIQAFLGTNEPARRLTELVDSSASLFAKGVFREAGVLTNQDIGRAKNAQFKLTDSAFLFNSKVQFFKALTQVVRKNLETKRRFLLEGREFDPEKDGVSVQQLLSEGDPSDSGADTSGGVPSVGSSFNGETVVSVERVD